MILATDVHYQGNQATAAGILFEKWTDTTPKQIILSQSTGIAEYISGEFYKRELPCLIELLEKIDQPLSHIIIDGFVHLENHQKPGLGKYLYDALEASVPVIGVAKSAHQNMSDDMKLLRGDSKKPLYITVAGIPESQAKTYVASMDGAFRLPTLLKLADLACRGRLTPDPTINQPSGIN